MTKMGNSHILSRVLKEMKIVDTAKVFQLVRVARSGAFRQFVFLHP